MSFDVVHRHLDTTPESCGAMSKDDIGTRWAEFLKGRYPPRHTAKVIAKDFGCQPRTATAWLGGNPPGVRQLSRAVQLFGMSVLADVFFPDTPQHKIIALQDRLAGVGRDLDALGGMVQELKEDVTKAR